MKCVLIDITFIANKKTRKENRPGKKKIYCLLYHFKSARLLLLKLEAGV